VGTGKTTLVNRLLDWLKDQQIHVAFIVNSRLNTTQLFEFVLAEFDIRCDSRSKTQQLMRLNEFLIAKHGAGETVVLIIDEAQNLTYPVMEEIRLLTNLETATDKTSADRVVGTARTRRKIKIAAAPPASAANQRALQDFSADE